MNRKKLKQFRTEQEKRKRFSRVSSKVSATNCSKRAQRQTAWQSYTIEQLNLIFTTSNFCDEEILVFMMTQMFGVSRNKLSTILRNKQFGKTHTAIANREKAAYKKLKTYFDEIKDTIIKNQPELPEEDKTLEEIREEYLFEQESKHQIENYGTGQDGFNYFR